MKDAILKSQTICCAVDACSHASLLAALDDMVSDAMTKGALVQSIRFEVSLVNDGYGDEYPRLVLAFDRPETDAETTLRLEEGARRRQRSIEHLRLLAQTHGYTVSPIDETLES